MIQYRPNYVSISFSLKDEQFFDTVDDMLLSLLDRCSRFASYIGADPAHSGQIEISCIPFDDPLTRWKNVRSVSFRNHCIGYFCERKEVTV